MTADTTRREHSGSGIRLGIGSCPGIAKILPAGIRGITLPDGTRVRMLRCAGRPRLYRPEKGGPILAFTVTDLRIRDTDEARMLRAGQNRR